MKSKVLFFLTLLSLFFCAPRLSAANTVASAQQVLTNLGFYHGPIDGSMGSGTSAALRRFQVANHLRPTGTLTSETSAALGLSKNKANTPSAFRTLPAQSILTSASTPNPKALADIFVGGPLLAASPEIQIATVQKAQRNLRTLGYYAGPINGLPDANFKTALQSYQKDSRFKQSGHLDKITLMGLDILPGTYEPGE